MKIAISAVGRDLESTIDERFGRCRHFVIVETDDMSYEVVDNTHVDLPTSAGVQAAGLVASMDVQAVITGNCGPKAVRVFTTMNIRVVSGQHGVIRDVVEKFKSGELDPSPRENVSGKIKTDQPPLTPGTRQPGMGSGCRGMGGSGRGMGGGGRGMGGGGRGMGGSGRGMGGT